jgi:hypothetical protein
MKAILLTVLFLFATATFAGSKGGDEFRKAAKSYKEKASQSQNSGHSKKAKIYKRLAEIKENAAKLADKGHWNKISWDEYHKLKGQLFPGHKK